MTDIKCLQCCDLCFVSFKILLVYILIIDSFGEICIFGRGNTVLIKCCHLIQALDTYSKDVNVVWDVGICVRRHPLKQIYN
jgi:hypothetical protein